MAAPQFQDVTGRGSVFKKRLQPVQTAFGQIGAGPLTDIGEPQVLLLVAEPVVPAVEIILVVKFPDPGLIKVFFRYQTLTGRAVKVTG